MNSLVCEHGRRFGKCSDCEVQDLQGEVEDLTEENSQIREALKNIEDISNSTPDKQHNDITIGDVSLMDNALQSIFEIAYKIRLKGDEDE